MDIFSTERNYSQHIIIVCDIKRVKRTQKWKSYNLNEIRQRTAQALNAQHTKRVAFDCRQIALLTQTNTSTRSITIYWRPHARPQKPSLWRHNDDDQSIYTTFDTFRSIRTIGTFRMPCGGQLICCTGYATWIYTGLEYVSGVSVFSERWFEVQNIDDIWTCVCVCVRMGVCVIRYETSL